LLVAVSVVCRDLQFNVHWLHRAALMPQNSTKTSSTCVEVELSHVCGPRICACSVLHQTLLGTVSVTPLQSKHALFGQCSTITVSCCCCFVTCDMSVTDGHDTRLWLA
jgi:hypothetical protein